MKQTLTMIVAVIITIAATFFITKCSINNDWEADINSLSNAYADTLHKVRNEKGQLETTTSVLETNKMELIELLSKNDSTIKRLTNINNRYSRRNSELITALAISNQIIAEYKDSISNIVIGDTIINDTVYQTYSKPFTLYNPYNEEDGKAWIRGNIIIGKFLFKLSLKVINEYDIAIYKERKNMFSKYSTYITITNKNPYDETKKLRTLVTNTPKKKHWVVFAGGGYGLNINIFGAFAGIGIGYKLFEF